MSAPAIRRQRFVVRFLGRPWAWLWLVGTGVPAAIAWFFVAVPARDAPGDQRSWFLWSGNILLFLFVLTVLFSARKWAIKLPMFRDFGRASAASTEAAWTAIQELNANIRLGAYDDDAAILAAAEQLLARHGTAKIQRPELRKVDVGARTVAFVGLRKREPFGRLEPWLEMHMGVGATACVAVLLHADFALRHPIGWTMLILSIVVLISGLFGALFYRIIPPRLQDADPGIPYEEAGVARETYDACLEGVLATLDDELREQLSSLRHATPSADALRKRNGEVLSRVAAARPDQADLVRDLAVLSGSMDYLRWNTAAARRLDFLLKIWRWVHVPVSVALFFVIALHVWAVLWY